MIAASGFGAVNGDGLISNLIVPAIVAPIIAFLTAGVAILVIYRIVGRLRPGPTGRGFRLGQIASSGLLALSHGTNDAQKTMGVITLALVAHGNISATAFHVPTWVVIASASAISIGTFSGGWRIIRTLGTRIVKMDPAQGFAAQGAGAAVILAASSVGYPLSTTHVISGGIIGAGAGKRVSAVRWGVAGNIAAGWVVTLPAAAIFGGLVYAFSSLFGHNAIGPLVITIVLLLSRDRSIRASCPTIRARARPVMSPAAIDAHLLLRVFYTAFAAGVGASVVFSLAVYGIVRSTEMRREQRTAAAASYGLARRDRTRPSAPPSSSTGSSCSHGACGSVTPHATTKE